MLLFMPFFHKILNGMSNSVGPNQTAPEGSGSSLFAYAILSEILVYKILGQLLKCTGELFRPT